MLLPTVSPEIYPFLSCYETTPLKVTMTFQLADQCLEVDMILNLWLALLALKLHPFSLTIYSSGNIWPRFTYLSDHVFPAQLILHSFVIDTPPPLWLYLFFSLQMMSSVQPPSLIFPSKLQSHIFAHWSSPPRYLFGTSNLDYHNNHIFFHNFSSSYVLYSFRLKTQSHLKLSPLCFWLLNIVPSYRPRTTSWMGMWFNHGLGDGRGVSQGVREVVLGNIFPLLRGSVFFSGHRDFRIWHWELSLLSCY